jgi:hypothetical protein
MKEKNKIPSNFTQDFDDESDLDNRFPSAKSKKSGHKAHTGKFTANWESDDAMESYVKGKASAHGNRRSR